MTCFTLQIEPTSELYSALRQAEVEVVIEAIQRYIDELQVVDTPCWDCLLTNAT